MRFMYFAAALGLAAFGSAAQASTLSFTEFDSTNGTDKLSPIVTISDATSGSFLVSVTHLGSSDGHLNLIAFDIGGNVFAPGDVTGVANDGDPLDLETADHCPNTGSDKGPETGEYCFGTSVPLGGNDNNLNGESIPDLDNTDVVLAFFNNDSIADNGSTLKFQISDLGGTIMLDDFAAVGLRYQSANNTERSDKLVSTGRTIEDNSDNQLPPVPLPAGGVLLAGALGLLGLRRRRAR